MTLSREARARIARQLAENHPGTVVALGDVKVPAQGEKEKLG